MVVASLSQTILNLSLKLLPDFGYTNDHIWGPERRMRPEYDYDYYYDIYDEDYSSRNYQRSIPNYYSDWPVARTRARGRKRPPSGAITPATPVYVTNNHYHSSSNRRNHQQYSTTQGRRPNDRSGQLHSVFLETFDLSTLYYQSKLLYVTL